MLTVPKDLLSRSELENRIINRQDAHKLEKITRVRRKPFNETLHNLCPSPNIIQLMEPNTAGWASHVTHVGEKDYKYVQNLMGKLKYQLEYQP